MTGFRRRTSFSAPTVYDMRRPSTSIPLCSGCALPHSFYGRTASDALFSFTCVLYHKMGCSFRLLPVNRVITVALLMLGILPPWGMIIEIDQFLPHAVCQRTCLYVNGNHVRKLGSVSKLYVYSITVLNMNSLNRGSASSTDPYEGELINPPFSSLSLYTVN